MPNKNKKIRNSILLNKSTSKKDLQENITSQPDNHKNTTNTTIEDIAKELEPAPLPPLPPSPPTGSLIIIDNFYNNPLETRQYILTQEFSVQGNYPGRRTRSFATEELKNWIQKYIYPFGHKMTDFKVPKEDGSDAFSIYNGAYQYTTSRDRSWVHMDGNNNWAGVLFLTPNAPLSSGTGFYRFHDGTRTKREMEHRGNKEITDHCSQDMTKWELVDRIGNVFNRLILFNSHQFHMSMDYFGDSLETGRLFQVFFFSTER